MGFAAAPDSYSKIVFHSSSGGAAGMRGWKIVGQPCALERKGKKDDTLNGKFVFNPCVDKRGIPGV